MGCGTFADATPGLASAGDQSQSPRLRLSGDNGISGWSCATCAVSHHQQPWWGCLTVRLGALAERKKKQGLN